MNARVPEPHVAVIEGRRVLVVERRPPLPSTLDLLLRSLVVSYTAQVKVRGARAACLSEQDHRLAVWVEGRHTGLDGVIRYLRLLMCQDCEAVCVRDVTLDRLAGLPTGGQPLRRRDHVIGWYSGARRRQREYR